ncbi:hypothetical protein BS78_07G177200 [Paspalum vaginatum]|nr:hypothetical protein BS78_07G177200 [Paspalum vaginatum]
MAVARFSAVLAVALLLAIRLAHAAPSTAAVFRRAVQPGSAMPDAILRLLRPENHIVNEAKPGENTGTPNSLFYYNNYMRSSATPAGDHSAVGARDSGDLDRNKGSSKRFTAESADAAPHGYDYKAPGKGDAGSGAKDELPLFWYHKAPRPSEHLHAGGHAAAAATTVFFHEEAVRVGERLLFYFPAAAPAALGLLPRHVADSIPFATAALPEVLALLGVSPSAAKAAGMAETLRTCELPPLDGEPMFCATSMEALVEQAKEALGNNDVRAVTSTLPRAGAPLQRYTVRAVRRVDGVSFVACHDEVYPYTVYRCHGTGPARAYMVEMEGARGGAVTVATVCHTDTSLWNPDHVSFKLLGTKPGGTPVCHLMPYGHIIWPKNVKT